MSEFGVGRGDAGCDVVRVIGEVLGRVRWLHVCYNIELILVVSHFRALIRNSNLKQDIGFHELIQRVKTDR